MPTLPAFNFRNPFLETSGDEHRGQIFTFSMSNHLRGERDRLIYKVIGNGPFTHRSIIGPSTEKMVAREFYDDSR
jgi:hypothetical protein